MRRLAVLVAALTAVVVVAGLGLTATGTEFVVGNNLSFAKNLPFVVTRAEAGQHYEDLVEPYNESIDRTLTAVRAEPLDLAEVRVAASATAGANRTFSIGLQKATWPREARDTVDELVRVLVEEQGIWRDLGSSESVQDVRSAGLALVGPNRKGNVLAELLRQQLDLPEGPKRELASSGPTSSAAPSPSPVLPTAVATPSATAVGAPRGSRHRFAFDAQGCAEVPESVLRQLSQHFPPSYDAAYGIASDYGYGAATMTIAVVEPDSERGINEYDFYVNSNGTLYDWSFGKAPGNLPKAPAALSENNAASMGLAICQERLPDTAAEGAH